MNKNIETKNSIDFCEVCLDDRLYVIKEEEAIEYARGKEIKYIIKQAYCTECNSPMYIPEINDENLEVLYSKVREKDNIISIEQINDILEKYNIGKRPLSLLLGWGEGTITRYLNGDIPTKNYSDTLKLILEDVDEMSKILELNKCKIKEIAYKKCRDRINDLRRCELAIASDDNSESKIKNIAKYIILKYDEMTPLALQKLLYYAQAFYKVFTEEYLFENDCEAWVHGPVYREIYDEYRNYGRNAIEIEQQEVLLTEIEERIVNSIIKYFGCYNGKVLEEMTHSEMPWVLTRKGLNKYDSCSRIIGKDLIDNYFNEVRKKHNLVNIDDIKQYSNDLFERIHWI